MVKFKLDQAPQQSPNNAMGKLCVFAALLTLWISGVASDGMLSVHASDVRALVLQNTRADATHAHARARPCLSAGPPPALHPICAYSDFGPTAPRSAFWPALEAVLRPLTGTDSQRVPTSN